MPPCGCGCGSYDEEEKEASKEVGQVVLIPCKYWSTLFAHTATYCPHCGARRTA